jgi:molybdopterin/thiamine biosynthesis adenylyltransferase/rhodanese-related sulfurtransferase
MTSSNEAARTHLEALRARIPEVDVATAVRLLGDAARGAVLIDIREADEIAAAGAPRGAHAVPRGFLELRIADIADRLERPVLVMCGSGKRSLFAAASLRELGYTDVRSVAGGFEAWQSQGLAIVRDERPALDERARERYARHLRMPEVGEAGQRALLAARVLVVGAGGLGSPAAFYLAAAGVGTLGIADGDVVERSNLQRQILHRDSRVGHGKAHSARETLNGLNPDIDVVVHDERVTDANVDALLAEGGYRVIVDGSDNFNTRYLLNDAGVRHRLPVVHGAVQRFEGQVGVFWPAAPGTAQPGPCYRCLFPSPPPRELAPDCATAGVLGVLPGVIGTLQAIETIKLLLGLGSPLTDRLMLFDALSARFYDIVQKADPSCPTCGSGKAAPSDDQAACSR